MECLRDSLFGQYGCVILDEAHERTLHTDVLLGKEFTKNLRRVHTPAQLISIFFGCMIMLLESIQPRMAFSQVPSL